MFSLRWKSGAILATLLTVASGTATAQTLRCLPTCNPADGRFLAIAGSNLITLSDTQLDLSISVPAGTTSFQVGVFDGDSRGVDAANVPHWDTGSTATYTFTLYADPLANNTGLTPVNLQGTSPTVLSTAMPDNGWIDFTVPTGAEALSPGGHYFYRLSIVLTTPGTTALNAFKVRTSAVISGVTLDPTAQPFSYIANLTSLADSQILYPSYPSVTPTNYDGSFSFYLDVPVTQSEISIWDGDFDRGKFNGTELDTDDPDTPGSPFLPSWATDDAISEGVVIGSNNTTGNPADDRSGAATGIYILKEPSVRYDLIFPDGQVFANNNPSGNQEWEQFKVSTAPFDPAQMDYSTPSIPPGVYLFRAEGVDMQNLNALLFPFRVLCMDDAGTPCTPLRPFLVGDTVFADTNGNGTQDAGEAGIPGVTVELLDPQGAVIRSTTTGANGKYSFEADAFTYTVRVASSNFDPAGALYGYTATAGNQATATVVDANVLTYDFGYRANASLGDRLWIDTDGDGVQDAGEAGIAGATVQLFNSTGLVATATTGTNGEYFFAQLAPGTYTVTVNAATLPAGVAPSYDLDGIASPNSAAVSLSAGANRTDVDFGYRGTAAVGDRIWNDYSDDDVQDAWEPGINGVTVELLDASGTVIATDSTTGDGSYWFSDLMPGNYTVRVIASTLPAGLAPTYDLDGLATANQASFSLAPGATYDVVDFGYRTSTPPPGTGTIGYWKNHPEAWPVEQIVVGGVTYTKSQAIALMGAPGKGDKSYDLFKQLVATKLNLILGNSAICISGTVASADSWQATFAPGSNVKGTSAAWQTGGPLHTKLDDYNNGELCAAHRD